MVVTKKAKRARIDSASVTTVAPKSFSIVADNVVSDTRSQLVEAATAEFNAQGFTGTDSNRIARRAGFAPQTFYRWFKDKNDVFIAVYQQWEETERTVIDRLLASKATTKQIIEATVAHHRDYLVFRRSLRRLSLEDPVIRKARAASRLRQLAQIKQWQASNLKSKTEQAGEASDGATAAALLQMERLADALAEGELEDMGLSPVAAQRALADIIEMFRR